MADRLSVWPVHNGELLVKVGDAGFANTLTLVVPAGPVHPAMVAVTEYIPVASVLALVILGFCKEEVKLFGPDQL